MLICVSGGNHGKRRQNWMCQDGESRRTGRLLPIFDTDLRDGSDIVVWQVRKAITLGSDQFCDHAWLYRALCSCHSDCTDVHLRDTFTNVYPVCAMARVLCHAHWVQYRVVQTGYFKRPVVHSLLPARRKPAYLEDPVLLFG